MEIFELMRILRSSARFHTSTVSFFWECPRLGGGGNAGDEDLPWLFDVSFLVSGEAFNV